MSPTVTGTREEGALPSEQHVRSIATLTAINEDLSEVPTAGLTGDPPRSQVFDLAIGIVGLWLAAAFILDSWAHLRISIDSFFTPFHATFYGAMLVGGLTCGMRAFQNHRRGYDLRHALPVQYRRALVGLPIFIVGGIGDLIWHTVFRVEDRIEAVTSPTHLILGIGVCLFISGPVSSALADRGRMRTLWAQLPTIFAIAAMVEYFHLGTCYVFDASAANSFSPPVAVSQSPDYFTATTLNLDRVSIGLLVVMLNAVLVGGIAVWLNARFAVAFGGNTLLFILAEIFEAAAVTNDTPLLAIHFAMALVAGLAADTFVTLRRRRSPAGEKPMPRGMLGAIVGFAYFATYFSATIVVQGTWWTWSLIFGAMIWATLLGSAAGMLAEPPRTVREGS